MHRSGPLQLLVSCILLVCFSFTPAQAQNFVSWVSAAIGDDTKDCSETTPCRSIATALSHTNNGGLVSVRDPGDYGGFSVQQSVSIVNDSGGTATTCCGFITTTPPSNVVVGAKSTDLITFHGLTLTATFSPTGADGLLISNARQVNIDDCTFAGVAGRAIVVAPANTFGAGDVGTSINVSVQDSIIDNSAAGIVVTSVSGVHVTAAVDRARINNNLGAGIRADGSSGGAITVAASDSTINLNGGNGVLALSGPGTAAVHVTRSVISSNVSSGVQSNQTNGGVSNVTVRGSTLTNNANGAVNSFGGGTLLTFGDNNIVGPNGTGFTGPIAMQ